MRGKLIKFKPVFFYLIGIGLNFLGTMIAQFFKLPVFLDSIGTILISAIGGYLPGVMAGFISNIITGMADRVNVYYCSINVMIAAVSALLFRRLLFDKAGNLKEKRCAFEDLAALYAALVISLTLIGGGAGSVLTWFLYGGEIGKGISSPLAVNYSALKCRASYPNNR